MPYGHIRQYEDLVEEAQAKRIKITRKQRQQIARMYEEISKDFGKNLEGKSEKTLTYRWIKDYAKSLKGESKTIYTVSYTHLDVYKRQCVSNVYNIIRKEIH